MSRRRACSLAAFTLASLASWAIAAEPEPLPEPPRPVGGARIQPPPEGVPAPQLSPTPAPAERPLFYGSIVSEPVVLYPHVRVKDADDMAPGAMPVAVAVRDPNCGKGPAGLVFIKVCVPIGPPCKVRV